MNIANNANGLTIINITTYLNVKQKKEKKNEQKIMNKKKMYSLL